VVALLALIAVAATARADVPATDDASVPDDREGTEPDPGNDDVERTDLLATAPDDPAIASRLEGTALADRVALFDTLARHHRPSRWGRLDVTVAWRRRWRSPEDLVMAAAAPTTARRFTDVVWLTATWRH